MACTCQNSNCIQSVVGEVTICTCNETSPINCPGGQVVNVGGNYICRTSLQAAACPGGEIVNVGGEYLCRKAVTIQPVKSDVISPVNLEDPTKFTDVSWTIAYSPLLNSWLSYYDFKPNYYVNHIDYFQTGINKSGDEFGLWSHLLTNKSYQVFYGKKYDFTIEYPDKNSFMVRTLNSVGIFSEARRYHDRYNYSFSPELTFNKAIIYNNVVNSGILNLIPQKNNLAYNRNYPKTNSDGTQDILISNRDNYQWSFDYIFNRVKSNVSNEPNWLWDVNQIKKMINKKAISFVGKKVLEYLHGDFFLINLTYNKDSRFKIIHKWSTQNFTIN